MEIKDKNILIRISQRKKFLLNYIALKNDLTMSRYIELMIDKLIFNTEIQIKNGELTYADIEKHCNDILQLKRVFKK